MKQTRKQKGFTLIELLIVVAIVGILLAVVVNKATNADTATKAQQITDDVSMIVTQSRSWKGGKVSYTGISVTVLTGMGLLDTNWGAGTGINPVGGNYTVAAASGGSQITVTATGMTTELCAAVANKVGPTTVSGTATCATGTLTATFR